MCNGGIGICLNWDKVCFIYEPIVYLVLVVLGFEPRALYTVGILLLSSMHNHFVSLFVCFAVFETGFLNPGNPDCPGTGFVDQVIPLPLPPEC